MSLVFEYYAGAANKLLARRSRPRKPGLDFTLREPIGVVGLIVPWNFPLNMAAWKLGPGAGGGQHVDPQAGAWTPLTAIGWANWRWRPAFRRAW